MLKNRQLLLIIILTFGFSSQWVEINSSSPKSPTIELISSDVENSIWTDNGYRQNIFEIGGEGTLRGYDWKEIPSSHYQLTTLEAWLGSVGVFYDRAIKFDSPENVFNATFFSDLSDNLSQNVKSSIGIILGRKNLRLSYAKRMTDNNNTTMYLTFGTPLQYR